MGGTHGSEPFGRHRLMLTEADQTDVLIFNVASMCMCHRGSVCGAVDMSLLLRRTGTRVLSSACTMPEVTLASVSLKTHTCVVSHSRLVVH